MPAAASAIRVASTSLNRVGEANKRFAQIAIEAGLFFVLAEAFLRRLFPLYSLHILAFKFAYFPALYLYLHSGIERGVRRRGLPPSSVCWLCWGGIVSLYGGMTAPATHIIGALVNCVFVPLALLGAAYYQDSNSVRELLRRLTLFGAFAGVVALFQSLLPPSHWLNASMNFEAGAAVARGGFTRVSSFFQHCNVFASFVSLGVITGLGWLEMARTRSEQMAATVSMLLLYVGGIVSGSRMATLGGVVVAVATLLLMRQHVKRVLQISLGGGVLLVVVAMLAPAVFESVTQASKSRAFQTNSSGDSLYDRVRDLYFGSNFSEAWRASDSGVGCGWGPYTMGASRYAEVLTGETTDGVAEVESGYSITLAQTGVVGILVFATMHGALLFRGIRRNQSLSWMVGALAVWSLIGNLPLSMLEIPVLAIPWWLLLGVAAGSPYLLSPRDSNYPDSMRSL